MTWKDELLPETREPYYRKILSFLESERESGKIIYPPEEDIFNAFKLTELENVKVVILGQDPYHGKGQAHGLSFSVRSGVPIPPSLQNIFNEIRKSISSNFKPKSGDLSGWANQGVLLLNTLLTVESGQPMSHSKLGWQKFTDKVIKTIAEIHGPDCIFLLLGNAAQAKAPLIGDCEMVCTSHPSPLSAHNGFLGSNCFVKINEYFLRRGIGRIDWEGL